MSDLPPGAPELSSVEDLAGQTVWVNPVTRVKDDLEALNVRLKAAGKAPAIVKETDPALEPGDVLEMVNAGTYRITLAPSLAAEFWAQVFGDLKVRSDLVVGEDVELGWALQKGAPKLKAFVGGFLETHRAGTSFGNTLMRRYLKEAKYVRNATSPSEMRKYGETAEIFRKYGDKYDVPHLLLVAQAYQESRLDQSAPTPVQRRSGGCEPRRRRWASTPTHGSATSRSPWRSASAARPRNTWRTSTSTTWPTAWRARSPGSGSKRGRRSSHLRGLVSHLHPPARARSSR